MRHGQPGTTNLDLETLPNYTLVSGLPTYDDALEQLRMNSSTNHLLINHQTLMKLFGSVKEKSNGKDIAQRSADSQVPTYDDAIRDQHRQNSTQSHAIDIEQQHITTVDNNRLDTRSSNASTNTVQSAHRFVCTLLPPMPNNSSMLYPTQSSAAPDPVVIDSPMLAIETPSSMMPSKMSSSSLGSLNIINEIKNSKPEVPWVHRSALSLGYDHDVSISKSVVHPHRASLY